jgi:hypothetical protein
MAEFVFTSPGIKFKERDLTYVTRNIGITTLGLVGETLKGPAFEPIFIQDATQFMNRFGVQSIKRFSNGNLQYQLPYVANAYLNESNQLWVTRVLGLSGYDAGKAWAITLNAGLDPTTLVSGATTTFTSPFSGGTFLGTTLYQSGDTGVSFTGFTKVSSTAFTGKSTSFVCTSYNLGIGTVSGTTTQLSGSEYTGYTKMVLAEIRSRGYVTPVVNAPQITHFNTTGLTITNNQTNVGTGDMFGTFHLISSGLLSGNVVTADYLVSMNPNASSFVPNVIGSEPKDKTTMIWVEATYPELIKQLDGAGSSFASKWAKFGVIGVSPYGYGINTTLIKCTSGTYSNYNTRFLTPETPWVVSQVKGNRVSPLFRLISISDGNSANQEIKISIANINPATLEFDVIIRSFYDTDNNPVVLETYSRCSLIKGQNNYIGQRIGTTDGEYNLLSSYVMVEMASDITVGDFPAGFQGYEFNNYTNAITGDLLNSGTTPKISYKLSYSDDEKIKKVSLGISETAYITNNNPNPVGINQNFFNFNGYINGKSGSGFTKTHGFHMDKEASGITSNGYSFDCGVGVFQTVEDVTNPDSPYYLLISRKFTFAPSGGFDGWDANNDGRTYGDGYQQNGIFDGVAPNAIPTNDLQAWETAIYTFANPETVTINLFSTPGINWSDQTILVQNTIDMIEQQRTDTLYVIDSPDFPIDLTVGDGGKGDVVVVGDIVDALNTSEINSSYSCTYYPWIQMRDTQNNVNVYIPPTGEVVRAMAYTDNTSFPWFAPAGLNRGVTNARKSKYKLSLEARDVLYAGRINPMADFADTGTAIFGQKTLLINDTALDRINVRRLLLQIKVLIANIAIRLVFEQNDQTTIDQFISKASPVLDTIKRERGLYDFRIKMDNSNNTPETRDRNELFGEIFLKPTPSLEFIGITFTVTPSGASFADVGA